MTQNAYSRSRFVVRLRCGTMGFYDSVTLPVAQLRSSGEDDLELFCVSEPEHAMLRALRESLSADTRSLHLYRVAAGTAATSGILTCESYYFADLREVRLDLDVHGSGPAFECAVLRRVCKTREEHYSVSKPPPELHDDVKAILVQDAVPDIPTEAGVYRVCFAHAGGLFTREGSQCLLRLTTSAQTAEQCPRYCVTMLLGSVELHPSRYPRFDAMRTQGAQYPAEALLSVEGRIRELVVAEALYMARLRTGREIASVFKMT